MIHAEGYAATGIQIIVEGADVPKGSFYNHFASKRRRSGRGDRRLFRARPGEAARLPLQWRCRASGAAGSYFDDRIQAFRAAGFMRMPAWKFQRRDRRPQHAHARASGRAFRSPELFLREMHHRGAGTRSRQPPISGALVGVVCIEQLGRAPCCACGRKRAMRR